MRLAAVPLLFGAVVGPIAVTRAAGPIEVEEISYLDPADVVVTVTVVDPAAVETMETPRPHYGALDPSPAAVLKWGRVALVIVLILITIAILSML